MNDERDSRQHDEEPPPFGGSWRTLYVALLVVLALEILLFYLFTRAVS